MQTDDAQSFRIQLLFLFLDIFINIDNIDINFLG